MIGRRVDWSPGDTDYPFPRLKPGEYGKDKDGVWYCVPPSTDMLGCLGNGIDHHEITEHEDGTITVSPSILITDGRGRQWHGYLKCGIWEEC